MTKLRLIAAATTAGAAMVAGAALAQTPGSLSSGDCFYSHQWDGWSSPGPGVIYVKVGPRRLYQVDLLDTNRRIDSGGRFLVFEPRGSSLICNPVDLNLKLADTGGYSMPLFVKSITRLTDEQIAAIPRKDRP